MILGGGGGVVKTLRRSNSLSRSVFSTVGSFGCDLEHYRSFKWHYRQRKNIFELILHFVADTDTDENYFGINFS